MTHPRGISSRVDVVWSRDDLEVEHINDVSSNFSSPELVMYTNVYTISLLATYDDDIVYQCEVIINSSPLFIIRGNVTLNIIGMCVANTFYSLFKLKTSFFYSSYTYCHNITICSYSWSHSR